MASSKTLSRGFGPAGRALIRSIEAEMRTHDLAPDAVEADALRQAGRLADRQAELAEILARDGIMVTTPRGELRTHPALVEARQTASTITRILSSVALTDTSGGSPGKSARHQRAAIRRWKLEEARTSG